MIIQLVAYGLRNIGSLSDMEGNGMPDENKVGHMSPYSGPSDTFDTLGKPFFWHSKAKQLKRAAWLVWQGVQHDFNESRRFALAYKNHHPDKGDPPQHQHLPPVMDPFVLLAALAIENLLKGVLVVDHPEYVKDGKLRGKIIRSHDLLILAKEANVDLDEDEKALCELGTSAIKGWGRYPISADVSKMTSMVAIKGTAGEVFEHLFDRLAEAILQKPFSS